MRKASLITGPDKIRCIYEIENSGQKYAVTYPYTKVCVNIFPVTNADIRLALEKMEIIFDGKITNKGIKILADKLCGSDRKKLDSMDIIMNERITIPGLKVISAKLAEDIASVKDGDLAINECEDTGLVRIVK